MSQTNPIPDSCDKRSDKPIFEAVITPHRSLGPTGFVVLMTLIGAVSFVAGVSFLLMGAWPVLGFFGLDVALIYFAFRASYKSGNAHETVYLSHDVLRVERVDSRGRRICDELNPYWAQLETETDEEFGILRLSVISRGKRIRLGDWLSPNEREEFRTAFAGALHTARSAPAA